MRVFSEYSEEASQAVTLVESQMVLDPEEFLTIIAALQQGSEKELPTERQQVVAGFINSALEQTDSGVEIDYDEKTWDAIVANPDYQHAAKKVRESAGKSDETLRDFRRNTALTGLRIFAKLYATHRAQEEA